MAVEVEVLVGDAGRNDYPPGSFDVILSNFGIMFFDDTEAAFRTLRAAMRPRAENGLYMCPNPLNGGIDTSFVPNLKVVYLVTEANFCTILLIKRNAY